MFARSSSADEYPNMQANAGLVETRSLSVGQVMETVRIMELPLNGRNPQELVLLGGGAKRDVVDFAVSLQSRIDDLHGAVGEVAAGLTRVDRRIDDTVSKTAIVRYDAYENSGGHQSASLALLDAARTGVVLSAIQGRDYARIYVKELDRGRASVALSPEELEAVERAMSS